MGSAPSASEAPGDSSFPKADEACAMCRSFASCAAVASATRLELAGQGGNARRSGVLREHSLDSLSKPGHYVGTRAREPFKRAGSGAQVQLTASEVHVHIEREPTLAWNVHAQVDLLVVALKLHLEMREGRSDSFEDRHHRQLCSPNCPSRRWLFRPLPLSGKPNSSFQITTVPDNEILIAQNEFFDLKCFSGASVINCC